MENPTIRQIAEMIDHSLLQPALTDEALWDGLILAREFGVASVCIKPYAVKLAKTALHDSPVKIGTVVGFPHGSSTTAVKLFEAEQALFDGARELDVVINIGKALSEDWGYVGTEIGGLTSLAHDRGAIVKVILETSALEDTHKIKLCELSAAVGADFVKTSTGYGSEGATNHDLQLMRRHSPPTVGVKAAGGVRTLDRLLEVLNLGVTRVGATATAAIINEAKQRGFAAG